MAAFAVGSAEVIADLAAQTLVPHVAADDQLPSLNAQVAGAQMVTNQFLGPALGGFAVADLGYGSLVVAAALLLGHLLAGHDASCR